MKIMDSLDSVAENELMIFWEVSHENIVRYFDHFQIRFGEVKKTFLITEFCEVKDYISIDLILNHNSFKPI